MFEWSEEQLAVRAAVRSFVEREIAPHVDRYEHGDEPPYEVLRRFYSTFGLQGLAAEQFERQVAADEARARGEEPPAGAVAHSADRAALAVLPIIELCRHSPGMVTALGVSVGLAPGAIMRRGTIEQKKRWALPLLTLERIGAWAITEPGSGSDAFGGMRPTARPAGDGFVIDGAKTFITNGPHADTIVVVCKLDDGRAPADRPIVSFVLDRGMPGLEQTGPLRKMGMHSSPTGEVFLTGVRVGEDRLLGGRAALAGPGGDGRAGARDTFATERSGVAAMALGIIERCLELSVRYARDRVQFGRPIGDFQLIQDKLARMEVARLNVQNLLFRSIEVAAAGRRLSLAEASAMKLYSARAAVEVAMEAVQVLGGNGYMAEYRVEQLARDARVLQIYGGTDEIQITHVARELLRA